jgi:hypothetical protein
VRVMSLERCRLPATARRRGEVYREGRGDPDRSPGSW